MIDLNNYKRFHGNLTLHPSGFWLSGWIGYLSSVKALPGPMYERGCLQGARFTRKAGKAIY
jgi:hypothetical protein